MALTLDATVAKQYKVGAVDGPATFTITGVVNGQWYVVDVSSNQAAATAATCVVTTNLSDTVTPEASVLWDSSKARLSRHYFKANSTANRIITATFSAVVLGYNCECFTLPGADTTDPFVQTVTAIGSSITPSATLAAFGAAANGVAATAVSRSTGTWTAGTGFGVIHQCSQTYARMFAEGQVANDTVADCTTNNSNPWAIIASEVKAATSGTGSLVVPIDILITVDPAWLVVVVPPPPPPPVDENPSPPPVVAPPATIDPGPTDVQAATARPRVSRSSDFIEVLTHVSGRVDQLAGQIVARHGNIPVYDGADPANPGEGAVWLRSDSAERCTRVGGITYREPLS